MSDPTPGGAGLPEPETPADIPADIPGGDETVRVPAAPEVAWTAPTPPEAPRALPWEPSAPTSGTGGSAAPLGTTPPDAAPSPDAPPAGVLSAAAVGWIAPPPEPVATGQPGWIIASTGARVGAYLIDGIVGALIIGTIIGIALAVMPDLASGGDTSLIAYSIAVTGFYFLYFVGFWTSGGQATPGMRLLKLRVANAVDGKRLAIGPAVIRWLSLGYIFSLIGIVPAMASLGGLINFFWAIILLITTATNPMHQGLHDRWANTVVVRPAAAGAGSNGWVVACLVVVVIIVLFMLVSIVGLILLGSQVSKILSTVGNSV